MDDLLEFIDHASDRGLMPAATAQALAVATRNVLGVLTDEEKCDLGGQDLDAVIKRFNNKRAKDFNPSSLKEYARRVHRAIDLYLNWRADPANFTVKTRTTAGSRKKGKAAEITDHDEGNSAFDPTTVGQPGTYQSSLPVRAGVVVTLANVPHDLTTAEANRLAEFIKMLAVAP
ncbi:MAG TPA: hypothetical protein VGG02_12520 [Chthoniobacterales bacterium]